MTDLWDELSDADQDKYKDLSPYHETRLREIPPNEMMVNDMNNENNVYDQTYALQKSLSFCEKIVTAAYKVAEYVPDLSNDKYADFWKRKVIPNLVDSLKQDVHARSILNKSMSSVRDLAITIQKCAEIVKQSKGSKKAIEIAQKNIPGALEDLEKCIVLVSKIENTAIEKFGEQTKTLFEIIGPEAVKYVDQKSEVESQLNKYYEDQQKLYQELGNKQGEVERLSHMISATEKQLYGANESYEATKRRTDELSQLNMNVEETIQSIPDQITQTVMETTHIRYGIPWKRKWWNKRWTETRAKDIRVKNPDRETDMHYYDSIVMSRSARIKANQDDEASRQRVINDLNDCLSKHQSHFKAAKLELKEYQESLVDKLKVIQNQIDIAYKKIEDLDKNELDTSNMIGYNGNTLIQCLVEVRTFAKSIKGGASAYAPLVSILSGIRAMVNSEVELLSSADKADVFLAGNRLLKQVKFLSSYSVKATKALQPSMEFRSLAIEFNEKANVSG